MSAGSPAFWCVSDEADVYLSILVGHDDQTWDIAVSLPLDTIDDIRREIAACPVPGEIRKVNRISRGTNQHHKPDDHQP